MRVTTLSLIVFFGSVALAQEPPIPADDPFTLSVDVNLALFNVTVQDNKGRIVSGLGPANFRIRENDQEQAINFFRAEDIPATIGLVIDNSGSMVRRRQGVIDAALAFAEAANPLDELFIVNFNDDPFLGLPGTADFTSDVGELRRALARTRSVGQTALYDAIGMALNHLERGRHQKKALIVLSDGADNVSSLSEKEILNRIEQSSATIYTVGIYDAQNRDRNPEVLKKMAKTGGGEAYFPSEVHQLVEIWEKVAGGLRNQYTLGFESSRKATKDEYRNVTITAEGKDGKALRVRARDRYLAPASVIP